MRLVRGSAMAWVAAAGLSMALGGCKGGSPTMQEGGVQEAPITKHLHCGEANAYTNASGKREFVDITATNHCEFTAYLWILFPNGRFIQKDIPSGGTFHQTTWLPPGGKVELECSLVSTIEDRGCDFSIQVLQRK